MTNDRPVYILLLVNINVYWPIICDLYCMTSFVIGTLSCLYCLQTNKCHKWINSWLCIFSSYKNYFIDMLCVGGKIHKKKSKKEI